MIISFLRFLLTLNTSGGVHTPAPLLREGVDALIDTGPDGRPQMPGTSMAGLLQQRLHDVGRTSAEHMEALFGTVGTEEKNPGTTNGAGTGASTPRVASRLWVFDAVATNDQEPLTRSTTAIDRQRGAAQTHTLRTVQTVRAGTVFEVFLRWDGPLEELKPLLDAFNGWRPRIGARVSTGQGVCSVSELHTGSLDLADPQDFLTWLTESGPALVRSAATVPHNVEPPKDSSDLSLHWHIEGPLTVMNAKAAQRGGGETGEDITIPMLTLGGRPLIPGSSIKGVVRSRMEYILRTVGLPACSPQAEAPSCGSCLPCRFFGFGGNDDAQSSVVGRRGVVMPRDAVVSGGVKCARTHVAIDRFTGGAAQRTRVDVDGVPTGGRGGMLFTVEAVEGGDFTMDWDHEGLQDEGILTALKSLLRLVADDFTDGLIGLGHSTYAGYGTITLKNEDCLPSRTEATQWLREELAAGERQGVNA